MLSPIEKGLFLLLVAVCITAAYNGFLQMAQIINRGQGKLNLDELPRRLVVGAVALFGQGRIIRHRRLTSILHWGVAWGFLFYFIVNGVDTFEGMITGFHFFEGNIIGDVYRFLADTLGAIVLIGVTYFILRRFAFGDKALTTRENVKLHPKARAGGVRKDSLVVALFILLHIGFRMLGVAFLIAQRGQGNDFTQPFANIIAQTFLTRQGIEPAFLNFGWHLSWWVALGLAIMFLPYFPRTKHAHLFMGPINFMTRPQRSFLGEMHTLDFEDESIEQFGATNLFDLEQTRIMDAFACIMCNRCQEVCPAYTTGKELSPAALEINKRYFLKENMAGLASGDETLMTIPLLDYAISESAVWACTACGACIDICPVGNEPMLDIMDIRRSQVLMESAFPDELQSAFRGMERTGNPWMSTESRMAWAGSLDFDVPTVEENPDFEYLLWVGCAGAFNPDAQKTVQSVATILRHAGVSFAVLGDAESCTGDSARRAGNEYLFYELAMGNIETLNAAGVDLKKSEQGAGEPGSRFSCAPRAHSISSPRFPGSLLPVSARARWSEARMRGEGSAAWF
jgi:heterodisulfide reductase subunit C